MGKPKRKKIPGLVRAVLADNVRQLMDDKYRTGMDTGNKPRGLARDAGVGLYTVQRILDANTGANLDTVEAIGKVFKAEAYELLTPLYAKQRLSSDHLVSSKPRQERVVALRQSRIKTS